MPFDLPGTDWALPRRAAPEPIAVNETPGIVRYLVQDAQSADVPIADDLEGFSEELGHPEPIREALPHSQDRDINGVLYRVRAPPFLGRPIAHIAAFFHISPTYILQLW